MIKRVGCEHAFHLVSDAQKGLVGVYYPFKSPLKQFHSKRVNKRLTVNQLGVPAFNKIHIELRC